MPALERWVYSFGEGRADGSAAMRDILGGKGAGLAEMANLGLPVPPGFTISAKLCIAYLEHGTFPDAVSYTHLPSPRDRQKSRMPSSA